jgi:hypothetical protein
MVTDQQVHEGLDARTMRMSVPVDPVRDDGRPTTPREPRFARPSVVRGDEDRARRHRERAIAAWLRDLSR